jgi:hypothetical protein
MIVIEGKKSFFLATSAQLIDDTKDTASAWANGHIHPNPAFRWILGNYVEADRANSNGQYWTFESLKASQESIQYSPINFMHRPRHILGAYTASEMLYPVADEADADVHPYVEALGVLWKWYFPNEMVAIEAAFNEGALAFSMECVGSSVTCAGEGGCGQEFAYAGPTDKSYCDHINKRTSTKQINNPHFVGGGLILPPARPGWGGASVNELAALNKFHDDQVHSVYTQIEAEMPHFKIGEVEAATASFLTAIDAAQIEEEPVIEEEENIVEETQIEEQAPVKNAIRLAREVLAQRANSAI